MVSTPLRDYQPLGAVNRLERKYSRTSVHVSVLISCFRFCSFNLDHDFCLQISLQQQSYSTAGIIPKIEGNVIFHQGLFKHTIPQFLKKIPHQQPLAFANIDCDLYSSTFDVLEAVHNRIVPGTVIVFDEYLINPTWRQDEFRAWRECCKRFGWRYEYLAFSLSSKQAVVRVIEA